VDRGQHEGRLEDHFPTSGRTVKTRTSEDAARGGAPAVSEAIDRIDAWLEGHA
jgi:hypothetical protein